MITCNHSLGYGYISRQYECRTHCTIPKKEKNFLSFDTSASNKLHRNISTYEFCEIRK